MERITDKQSMLAWAMRVQNNGGNKAKCDRQDEFMRSQFDEIKTLYRELDQNDIRTVSCAIYNVLNMDVLWELIRSRARKIAAEQQEELFRDFDKYQTERNDRMDLQRKELLGKMEMLRVQEEGLETREAEVESVKRQMGYWKEQCSELSRQIVALKELQEKADKYDELRRLLA